MIVVTDFGGVVVEWEGSAKDAIKAGLNVDCEHCVGCMGCFECADCIGCNNCNNCTQCKRCNSCNYNNYCVNCTKCDYCVDCNGCRTCCNCADCVSCLRCDKQPLANIITGSWPICIRNDKDRTIRIGCQDYTAQDWLSFDDNHIDLMSYNAVPFWRKWRPVIEAVLNGFGSAG